MATPVAPRDIDPDRDTWRETARLPITVDLREPMAIVDGRMIIVGTDRHDALRPLPVAYDPRTDTWERLPEPPFRTGLMEILALDGSVVVLGQREVDGMGMWEDRTSSRDMS